jgi:hypothetical protein
MELLLLGNSERFPKPFKDLSLSEATLAVQNALNVAEDEEQLHALLTAAGFDPEAADIDNIAELGFKIRIWGQFPDLMSDDDARDPDEDID